jgi:hypothetical protein
VTNARLRVALLYPGNRDDPQIANPAIGRFASLFRAFSAKGMRAEPAVYHDDFCDDVRAQISKVDGVLVWVNPLEGGRDRSVLDSMLCAVAAEGVFVSTHPDIIMKLGTKEVLYRTREIGWSCDTHIYRSLEQLRQELPLRLVTGKARVLKQNRGNGGSGVWKVEWAAGTLSNEGRHDSMACPEQTMRVRARHAMRGCYEEEITLEEFVNRCSQYFSTRGLMVDQEYQERLPEGMIRCYLTHGTVTGFGQQAVNALYPAPAGNSPKEAPQPGTRYYHAPTKAEFQTLRTTLEQQWLPEVQQLLNIETESLPIIWDCDFLHGPKGDNGEDTYVLCEINVSSVAPYPESSVPFIVEATHARLVAARQNGSVAG